MTKIKIAKTEDTVKSLGIAAALIIGFFASYRLLGLDVHTFVSRLGNAQNVISRLATFRVSAVPEVMTQMFSSISMAAAGLIVGCLISLVLAFLAASNISPNKLLGGFIKGVVAVIRAIPALVWILMVVASIGFGNTAGMVGLIFPTTGYLTKSFIASIEEMGYDTIEAMRTTGAGWLNIVIKGLFPGLIRPFTSWVAIRLEGNIAESISLGMVGVGGIGSLLMKAIGKYDYQTVSTTIVIIFLTMFAVELAVQKIKSYI